MRRIWPRARRISLSAVLGMLAVESESTSTVAAEGVGECTRWGVEREKFGEWAECGTRFWGEGGVGRGAMMVSMRWRNLNAQFEQVGVEMRVRKKARKGGIDSGFGNRRARRGLVYATRQLVYRSSESRSGKVKCFCESVKFKDGRWLVVVTG